MDELLPANGYNRGTIVEWISGRGSGSDFLSLLAAKNAAAEGGGVVIVDPRGEFYPPAARAIGLKLSNLIILRSSEQGPVQRLSPHQSQPLEAEDLCWAMDQSLRSPAIAAVWGTLPELDSAHEERTWLRRFQLSAESSGCLGLFNRSPRQSGSSWSEVQWQVTPQPSTNNQRRIHMKLARCQGGIAGQSIDLEVNMSTGNVQPHEPNRSKPAHSLPLAAQLANPAPRRRSARA
ncbi:MAG: hypothetical protein VX768_08785 [Planctomycetota bacterium]|nr:hypothetical protein [Planctomycetota bacterium]